MMYATLTADGTFERHEGVPKLEQMQELVRSPDQKPGTAMVEVMQIKLGIDMWFNEEGKYVFSDPQAAVNHRATMFAREHPGLFTGDYIAGDVLFTGSNGDGETVGLTVAQYAYVAQAVSITEIGREGSGVWNMTGVQL
jgi:Domain of unknown function (DUF3846)